MTENRIIAYLLEELPKEELEQFEEDCFGVEDWPDQIELVEEDLIDAYLRHELTTEQRQHFERNYLTTGARKDRVIMAAALLGHLDDIEAAPEPTVRAPSAELSWAERLRGFWSNGRWQLRAAAALTLVIIVVGGFWFYLSRETRPQSFATLILEINVSNNRAEGVRASRVMLPLKADALKIFLKLPAGASPNTDYRVTLENDSLDTKTLKIAERDAQSVAVDLPAAQLKRGLYALRLFATQTNGTEQRIPGNYFFEVE